MRPIRLTMQAFGPYPGLEVVDFRSAIEAGLFGIYGQTGSGKSTIFSAMTFALFGESAKTDQEAPSLRSDHADAAMQTEVELVFEIGDKRYVILRRPEQSRPKQRGEGDKRSAHEAFLFEATGIALEDIKEGHRGKIIAEKKVRDVDTAVVGLLGYRSEQFRQIVLLPQGRFETFLSAKTKDRLEILRDLFDVSLYRTLTGKLKTDAEAAERHVREEREICARRLAAENFESTDALALGIADAGARHDALLTDEASARAAHDLALMAVQESRTIDALFEAAEGAQRVLAELQERQDGVDALAGRVARAERARAMLDAEAAVAAAATETREAEKTLGLAQKAQGGADAKFEAAADILKKETERAGEIDILRQQVEEFDRHTLALEKASGAVQAVAEARAAQGAAVTKLNDVRRRSENLQGKQRTKTEALKAARKAEEMRQDFSNQLIGLNVAMAASETYETAKTAVAAAVTNEQAVVSRHDAAKARAQTARAMFDDTERSLSEVQALHLASKLAEGEPCPVCGSSEHPAPATGAIEHAGLDQAFRDARDAWQAADDALRKVEQNLAGVRSTLSERQARLASLDVPAETSAKLRDAIATLRKQLDGLGTKVDITEAEVEVERLAREVVAHDQKRETLRAALSECDSKVASEETRLEEMLVAVPQALRDRDALAAARDHAAQALAMRRMAKEKAEAAATTTRDAALVARKDREAAAGLLARAQDHHRGAVDVFASRLDQAGLTADEFRALKPAIATIETDRAAVETYRRKLENAVENAQSTAEAVEQQDRPDLSDAEAKRHEAELRLTDATEQRMGARHRLDQLSKLQSELAETLRTLEAAEAKSGPLRDLAALVNGENPQRLDLETFAIGAMFDRVLEAANLRLGPMTNNRYRLERDLEGSGRGRRGLGIQAFDFHTGKARPTATLSGGETFIAALTLALGLADVVESASGKVRLDTIFIDEGFGSLDTENGSGTLDKVLEVLSSLVRQNRAVGLISHVPLVQEAIPNGFYVRKHLTGSHVEVRGAI